MQPTMKVSDFGPTLPSFAASSSSVVSGLTGPAFEPETFIPLLESLPLFERLQPDQKRDFVVYLRQRRFISQVSYDPRGYEKLLELMQAGRHFQTIQELGQFLEKSDPNSYLPLLVPPVRQQFEDQYQKWLDDQAEVDAGEERAYSCHRCKRNRFMDLQLQLKSADEGATIITKCVYCGAIRKKE